VYSFIADLPGLREEEVKVQIEETGNCCRASAARRTRESRQDSDGSHRARAPAPASSSESSAFPTTSRWTRSPASAQSGVLTVTVPKLPLSLRSLAWSTSPWPDARRCSIPGGCSECGYLFENG